MILNIVINLACLYLITALPFLELRASIPYGILAMELNLVLVFLTCIVSNILIAPLIWFFVEHIMHFFLKITLVERIYQKIVIRTQKRVKPYVKKYGTLGLAIFIGIPLPGSGVYSGCLGAYLLGYKFKDYLLASIIGVLIAGIIVTIVTLTGVEMFSIFTKHI